MRQQSRRERERERTKRQSKIRNAIYDDPSMSFEMYFAREIFPRHTTSL